MSESGRKRSRKTKLVPRDCAEFIDDDAFLQVPKKVKREPFDHGDASSALQFSVKVEVEDVDTLPDEDPSDYMKYLFSLSQEFRARCSASRNINEEKFFVMDPTKIHKLLPALLRRYPYEREAVVATRNSWGKLFHEMAEELPRSLQDSELQQTINEWRSWYITHRQRETPFCYKCYVCSRAWWNFMDFRDHVKQHPDSYVKLEIVHQECNVICYEDTQPGVKEIYVDGKCTKCAMTFKEHRENRKFTDYFYYCIHCNEKFLSCGTLSRHVGTCEKNPIHTTDKDKENDCLICEAAFPNKLERDDHLSVCHSVRSDEPIATHFKICRQCEKPYILYCYHVCTKKNILHPCKHCSVKFQNKQMLDLHTKMSKKGVKCTTCDKYLMKKCMEVEHLVTHSENFLILYRCLTCKKIKLFQGDANMKNHRMKNHRRFDSRRPGWEKIIVPKLMLEQCQFNPNARQRKKIPVKQIRKRKPQENNVTIAEDEDLVINKSNDAAKYYNKQKEINIENQKETQVEEAADVSKILEQITETVDLKPDIVKVKEEKDDEMEPVDETTEPPRLNTEELQLDPEVSKVFQASIQNDAKINENYDIESIIVKHEIKEEPAECVEDLIIVNETDDSAKHETSGDQSDQSILKLEPEVILNAGYRKKKIYKCNKCDFNGFHREYRQHVNNHCMKIAKVSILPTECSFTCTKCAGGFENMKTYAQHFVKHRCEYMSCPQCGVVFENVSKLIPHLNSHIKNQFLRIQQISDTEPDHQKKDYQCKTCRKVVFVKNMFDHWEEHLVIIGESQNKPTLDLNKVRARGDYALHPQVLERILELLQNSTFGLGPPKKVKTCFVCQRTFERQNDCKRHLIEHLLEDALANIPQTYQLKCQICTELFKKPDGYKKHMRDHGSLPIYQCALCNKTFSDSSNFTKHKKIHNTKAYVCDVCNKKFQVKLSLEKHMEMHLSTEPYHCNLCDRVFHDRSFFNRHRRQMHEKTTVRYRCFVCKEGFDSLKEKWDHMWEVHQHRTNKADCPICKKGYRKFSDVKKHCQQEHCLNITLEGMIELMAQYKKARGADYYDREGESSDKVNSFKCNEVPKCNTVIDEKGNKVEYDMCSGVGSDDSEDDVLLIEEERETLVIYDDDAPT